MLFNKSRSSTINSIISDINIGSKIEYSQDYLRYARNEDGR